MKKLLLLFFVIASHSSYSQDTIKVTYRPWISSLYYATIYDKAKWNSSVIKIVDLRGHIRFVGRVDSDCGTYTGETKEYFRNGQLKKRRLYVPVKPGICAAKEGTWVYYKKNGAVKKKITYSKGVKISEGK